MKISYLNHEPKRSKRFKEVIFNISTQNRERSRKHFETPFFTSTCIYVNHIFTQ